MDLRAQAEKDTAITLEGDWSQPVVITKVDDEIKTQNLKGQVLYDYEKIDTETGEPVIVNNPIVTLRITSIVDVPIDGESWYFDIPTSPVAGAAIKRYVFDIDSGKRGFKSLGIYTYPLKEYENES